MPMREHPPTILVSGAARPGPEDLAAAEEIGRRIAAAGGIVLTGGGSGVMEAASRGAREAGGTTLAVLPGRDASESPPNPHVDLAVFTGMGDARNAILVRTADAVIAIGGGWGTLSEIALAMKAGRTVILLGSWSIDPPDPAEPPPGGPPTRAKDAAGAVSLALAAARAAARRP